MGKYACIWIDHRHAKVFDLAGEPVTMTELFDERPDHHIHQKADHVGLGKEAMSAVLLQSVAESLATAIGILIMAPAEAKTILAGYLNERHPVIAKHVWEVRASDHPTDAQIVAEARTYFDAAGRMHA